MRNTPTNTILALLRADTLAAGCATLHTQMRIKHIEILRLQCSANKLYTGDTNTHLDCDSLVRFLTVFVTDPHTLRASQNL
jgi:hypothetical protein